MKRESAALYVLMLWAALANAESAVSVSGSSSFDKDVNGLLSYASDIKLGPGVVAAICIVVGTLMTFFGYKLLKPIMFVCGFAVGSVVAYIAAERIFKNQSYLSTACWIAFFVGGVLVGFLVMWFFQLGIFLVGAAAGILLAFTCNTTFGYKIWPSNPDGALYVMIAVLGLVGGFLALCIERPILIIATSLFGSVAAVWGVGYFAGKYPNGEDLKFWRTQLADGTWDYNIPNAWWYYLAATIVLFIIGMYIQFHSTASGVNHNRRGKHHEPSSYANHATPHHHGDPVRHV